MMPNKRASLDAAVAFYCIREVTGAAPVSPGVGLLNRNHLKAWNEQYRRSMCHNARGNLRVISHSFLGYRRTYFRSSCMVRLQEAEMRTEMPNHCAALDTALTLLSHFEHYCRRATERGR